MRNYINSIELALNKNVDTNKYPFSLQAVKSLNSPLRLQSPVTFIVGENGSGKSTLLEAIAVSQGFNPEGGSVNFNFSNRNSHSILFKHLKISRGSPRPQTGYFLRSESFYNLATEIDNLNQDPWSPPLLNSYGGKSLHEQSHGESFFSLIKNRFGANGLYILDEPEAAISPKRQIEMIYLIHQLVLKNCQFIIATHSPILLSLPNSDIYEIKEGEISLTEYEQTETFSIAKHFLTHHSSLIKHLLKDE
ncbi:MAG: AAA family ATPase [Lentisphaeraceae bacterium]|nr:AAA family ATPase [Lentisphaeraceae bacterium]